MLYKRKKFYFGGAKVIEILELASSFHKNWDWTIAHELVNLFKLNPNNKMRQLSRGMESLVGNIVGLASRARFTIYDEPVIGLDVLMREKFYKLLMEDYANNPRTILISTHLVDEISKVVGRIVIIEAGSILLHDDADNIRIHSHLVTGNTQAIEQFTSGKRVFYKESYGKGMFAAVYDKFSEADKALATKLGVEIDGLPLQKFFAYLIEGGEQVE